MLAEPLSRALEATGYLSNNEPAAPSVTLAGTTANAGLPSFKPDAWWRSNAATDPAVGSASNLTVYFKFVEHHSEAQIADWQKEVWNRGFAPLLWVVSPGHIQIYNGYGVPQRSTSAAKNLLKTFEMLDEGLARLDALAGRLAMETGQFWRLNPKVNRETGVAGRLLYQLSGLERDLVDANLDRGSAQELIGRAIFVQYLIDRGLVSEERLIQDSGYSTLPQVLFDRPATIRLFKRLQLTFNGDMFPPSSIEVPHAKHLARVARFLRADDTESGQLSLFPYRFDVIPVGLISSIYEQFVHSSSLDSPSEGKQSTAKKEGVYYTPPTAVALVLDEVFDGLAGGETILDLTCGSGAFLVEALKRLVHRKARGAAPCREMIDEALYTQVYGVDKSAAAIRVAAFSLYLASMELDPGPHLSDLFSFGPLVGKTLLVGDAHSIEKTAAGLDALTVGRDFKKFDVIVGNPPWTFRGKAGTAIRRARRAGARSPRGESLDFVVRAKDFAHSKTRFGMIVSATPFFSRSTSGLDAVREALSELSPLTLVNLGNLSGWLFKNAQMPALAMLARHRGQRDGEMTLVQTHWSQSGESSHAIEIAPSDVTTLPIASWERNPGLLKAAFMGRRHDLLLLDRLHEEYGPLESRLADLGTGLNVGLQTGNKSQQSVGELRELPFAANGAIGRFLVPEDLPVFSRVGAQWPRSREIYRAPLLLMQQNIHRTQPRPVVAVSQKDLVYAEAYVGVSFGKTESTPAYLLAGILSSAVASWYLLMTGSAFGLWRRQAKKGDIAGLPIPNLKTAADSEGGRRVEELVRGLHQRASSPADWEALDERVFDLYGFDSAERVVVRDGLVRASWQWAEARRRSTEPASLCDRERYTQAFLAWMNAWMAVSNRRRMRAEIYDLEPDAPIGVVRFVMDDAAAGGSIVDVSTDAKLKAVLTSIGAKAKVQIARELIGVRELRVHAENEVSIIKPAALRHWLGVCGLEDADAVMRDSIRGNRTQ